MPYLYLWLAGINASIKTPLPQAPEVNSSVGAFHLLGDLKGAPFMGAFEVRQGPLGFLGDVLHVPVGTKITHNLFFQGGNAALKTNMGTGLVLYRLVDQPTQFADAGLGFRAWGFSADLSLNPGLLPGQSVNRGSGWGDPLIGGRYHYDFGNGFGATAYGDVGGFGVGAHSRLAAHRHDRLHPQLFDQSASGLSQPQFQLSGKEGNLGFNVHMKGPILAGTFRF